LKEANDNAEKLAQIAEELANAKEFTDTIVQDIQDGYEQLMENIHIGEGNIIEYDSQAETLRFEADNLSEERAKAAKVAELDSVLNKQEAQRTQNKNDERLAIQYETQIRALQNQFIITKAILDSELANAQLMVAIKMDMNRQEDIADINEKMTDALALTGATPETDAMNVKI